MAGRKKSAVPRAHRHTFRNTDAEEILMRKDMLKEGTARVSDHVRKKLFLRKPLGGKGFCSANKSA